MRSFREKPAAGTWRSPVRAELLARRGLRLAQPMIHEDSLYWLEGRSSEKGRTVLVKRDALGNEADLTPPPFNVRSGAHEYGGGVYCFAGTRLWFTNFEDQCIYEYSPEEPPRPLTAPSDRRYADLCADPARACLIAVSEDHASAGEPAESLISVSMADGAVATLAEGCDFYSSPCIDHSGQRLAWLAWNHPDMPWDSTTLHVADRLSTKGLLQFTVVAGGDGESIFQPGWGPDGRLYFMSDRSGWWNLHRWDGHKVEPLMNEAADCGFGQWVFGMSTWGFVSNTTVLCSGSRGGIWSLALVDIQARTTRWLDLPFNTIEHVATGPGRAALIAASKHQALSVIDLNPEALEFLTIRESVRVDIGRKWISSAKPLSFPTSDDSTAHAFYYPPVHASNRLGETERPPLIVKCHGGPTAHADAGLDWRVQFWTTRGFAVLDVNYRGSTGFGRRYRDALRGQWGIYDVDDAVNGALYLVQEGLADPGRLAVSGGSAGGFTVLSALTFRDVFGAGTSLYGVSDLTSLMTDTHKFEARYLDGLVGPYPDCADLYADRSPLRHANRLSCPVLFLQGLLDKVVTPDQSERMVASLRNQKIPVLYLTFPEEGHGFRHAETIITALEAELYFYGRIFGFEPTDLGFSANIENLDD